MLMRRPKPTTRVERTREPRQRVERATRGDRDEGLAAAGHADEVRSIRYNMIRNNSIRWSLSLTVLMFMMGFMMDLRFEFKNLCYVN